MVVFKRTSERVLHRSSFDMVDEGEDPNSPRQGRARLESEKAAPRRSMTSVRYSVVHKKSNDGQDEKEGSLPRDIALWITRNFTSQSVGIMVSDMSGFTRLTRAHGIIHFASIIMRMRQLCLPILHFFEALFITTEADNFIVVFGSAASAALAALSMQQVVAKYNELLPQDKAHFALTLNGVGVDYGEGPLIDKNGKLHGRTFSTAYALGEDLCEAGCVLISGNVKNELVRNPKFSGASYVQREDEDAEELSAENEGLFDLNMNSGVEFKIPDVLDTSFLKPTELAELTRRHDYRINQASLDKYDDELREKYMHRRTVLMFEFEFEDADDAQTELVLEFHFLRSLKMVFDRHHAQEVENVMYMFNDPVEAILSAVDIQERYEQKAALLNEGSPRIKIRGMGVHMGDVFVIPETDVHWGDPINTASKLGQDLAKGGDILISDVVYEEVKKDERLRHVSFLKEELTKSKVNFVCFKVIPGPSQMRPMVKEYATIQSGCCNSPPMHKSRGWLDYLFCACTCDKYDSPEPISLVTHETPDRTSVELNTLNRA